MGVLFKRRTLDEELKRLGKTVRDTAFRIELRRDKQITVSNQREIDELQAELVHFLKELDRQAHLEKIKVMRKVLKILSLGKDKK